MAHCILRFSGVAEKILVISLGYKDKVTWETIQNPYVPDGMIRQWQEQAKSQQAYNTLLNTMVNIVPKEHENTEDQK